MFTGRAGCPKTIEEGEEPNADAYEGGDQGERHPRSEVSANEEEEEEEDGQEFSANKAEQETPGAGSGHIDQIMDSTTDMASSVALLQVQAGSKRRLPQSTRKVALLRRAPKQARQSGMTGNRLQQAIKSPPAPAPAFSTTLEQVRVTPNFQPTLTLTPVHRTCDNMAVVAATAPNPSVPRFPGIFTLLEDGENMTPQLRIEKIETLPLGERPPLVVCLEAPEPHIRVIWGAHFVTLSFAQFTPEDRKVLNFSRDIHLGLLPDTVVVQPLC